MHVWHQTAIVSFALCFLSSVFVFMETFLEIFSSQQFEIENYEPFKLKVSVRTFSRTPLGKREIPLRIAMKCTLNFRDSKLLNSVH